ncbi:MAG: serine/threonine-protein phosphatase [Nitrosopumilaceae archaeon]|nr:serine/threonine-protein phosphatase [Nitrosopumilaceae archaeon]
MDIPGGSRAHAGGRGVGLCTDVGRVRPNNEDAIMAVDVSAAAGSGRGRFLLLMVADGMGGCPRGEEASRIALDSVAETVASRLSDGARIGDIMADGIRNANRDILVYARRHSESEGMGTTLVCALVAGDRVHLASVGDSRAYVVGGRIRQVTRDHTHAQDLADRGLITAEESRSHPGSCILTRAVGMPGGAEPDMEMFDLGADESLLLCSDGVTAHLADHEILAAVSGRGAQDACRRVVDIANGRGGRDNVSLVMLSAVCGAGPW